MQWFSNCDPPGVCKIHVNTIILLLQSLNTWEKWCSQKLASFNTNKSKYFLISRRRNKTFSDTICGLSTLKFYDRQSTRNWPALMAIANPAALCTLNIKTNKLDTRKFLNKTNKKLINKIVNTNIYNSFFS